MNKWSCDDLVIGLSVVVLAIVVFAGIGAIVSAIQQENDADRARCSSLVGTYAAGRCFVKGEEVFNKGEEK